MCVSSRLKQLADDFEKRTFAVFVPLAAWGLREDEVELIVRHCLEMQVLCYPGFADPRLVLVLNGIPTCGNPNVPFGLQQTRSTTRITNI